MKLNIDPAEKKKYSFSLDDCISMPNGELVYKTGIYKHVTFNDSDDLFDETPPEYSYHDKPEKTGVRRGPPRK